MMKSAKLRTSKNTLKDKRVEWVSVIETPVENFVRENEFVLSTGIGCGHDPLLLKEFVQNVLESGATALAIAIGRFVFDISGDIIRLAEDHNFPIIEIPWEVRFSEITHSVMIQLNQIQKEQNKKSEEMQQELLRIILSGGEIVKVAEFVQYSIGEPIFITDQIGLVKVSTRGINKLVDKWNHYLQSAELPRISLPIKKGHHPLHSKLQCMQLEDELILQVPIESNQKLQGYLMIPIPDNHFLEFILNNENVNRLEHASTALALCFLRENAIEETEMRLRDDFVWSLTKDEIPSWDHLSSRATVLGYDVSVPYVCIVGSPENLQKLYRKAKVHSSYDQWLKSMTLYIEDEIYQAAKTLQRKSMTTYQTDLVIIFLEISSDQKNDTVNHFLDLVDRRLKNILPGVVMTWGIGRNHEGLCCFQLSYEDAKIAIDVGRPQKGSGSRITFDETRINRALLTIAESPDIQEITATTIGSLIEYDQERNMDLIGTFIAYNRHQGNVSQTARALNLHRQSLLYRLRKIESLTGLSLVDPDNLFLLDLSIKIWMIARNTEQDKIRS